MSLSLTPEKSGKLADYVYTFSADISKETSQN